jgi:hypothetical protein
MHPPSRTERAHRLEACAQPSSSSTVCETLPALPVRATLASRAPAGTGVASSRLIMHQACIKSRGSHYSRSNPTLPHAAPHPRSTSARYVTHKASSISRNPFHLLVLYSGRLLHVRSRSLSNQCSESVDMCNNRGLDVPRLLRRRPIF